MYFQYIIYNFTNLLNNFLGKNIINFSTCYTTAAILITGWLLNKQHFLSHKVSYLNELVELNKPAAVCLGLTLLLFPRLSMPAAS